MSDANNKKKETSDFLIGIAHELRTPLNAIIGFCDLITEEESVDEIKRFAKIIQFNSNNLLSIIDDTFNLALIESGKASVRNEEFDLDEFFKKLSYTTDHLLKKYNKTDLWHEYVPDKENSMKIRSDQNKIQQVFINLIKNAIKFTDDGFIKYGYSYHRNYVSFFVQDSGIGIPFDKQEIIFERFEQIKNGVKSNEGAGLGLAICKKLVELLDGSIAVRSTLYKGSKFTFLIPCKTFRA